LREVTLQLPFFSNIWKIFEFIFQKPGFNKFHDP